MPCFPGENLPFSYLNISVISCIQCRKESTGACIHIRINISGWGLSITLSRIKTNNKHQKKPSKNKTKPQANKKQTKNLTNKPTNPKVLLPSSRFFTCGISSLQSVSCSSRSESMGNKHQVPAELPDSMLRFHFICLWIL